MTTEGEAPPASLEPFSIEDVARMVSHLSDGIVVLSPELIYRYVSDPAAEMLGRTADELVGRHIWTEFPAAEGLPVHQAFAEALRSREPVTMIEFYEPLDRWYENRIFPLEDGGLQIVFRDVTRRELIATEMRQRADRAADTERLMHFGTWRWEVASGRVSWSDELQRIHGLEVGEFGGTTDDSSGFIHPDDLERISDAGRIAIDNRQSFLVRERIIRTDGEERMLLSEGHPILASDGSVEAFVGVCNDITERTDIERALGASERRTRAIIDNTPSVITVKDLDGRYVMTNAEASRVFDVPTESLIGSFCADFFPPEVAEAQRANDMLAATEGEAVFDELMLVRGGEPRTYITVTFPLPDEDGRPAEMCTIATDVTDSQEREVERLDRISWESRIDSALEDGRMCVYAQPIVDLGDGVVVSRELLVRMKTPGEAGEILPPAAFLPAAERFGLIQRIDCWMISRALALTNGSVAEVNLSAVTLCDPDARREIVKLLAASPEAAHGIIFEITETAVAEHLDAAGAFAAEVTALGCRLALDDFGTGFGSLTYLHTLPLSFIKIDLSFIRALSENPQETRLVKSIIEIGRVFGLKTIAEGVEDEAMITTLTELGADYAQGYHLGRPAPLPSA